LSSPPASHYSSSVTSPPPPPPLSSHQDMGRPVQKCIASVYNCAVMFPNFDRNFNSGFELLTAVVMKSTIFWDITPCSPLSVNRRFGGTYRIHLQGRIICRARNQRESRWPCQLTFRRNIALIFRVEE
jgi:hypothetical protein